MSKKNILFTLALIFFTGLSLALHTQAAEAKVRTGSCGEEAVWKYNSKTKVLKITGKGELSQTIKLRAQEVDEVLIGEGITAINNHVFLYITDDLLKKFVLPDSLKKISVRAFAGMNFPNGTITLPAHVKKIEPGAFWGFTNLAKIKVSGKNKYFASKNGVLFSKDYKTLVCYPKEKKAKNYKIPETVTEIKPMAFAESQHIQKVHLPKGLKKLGSGAFYLCGQLSEINLTRQSKITEITDYDARKIGVSHASTEFDDYYMYFEYIDKRPQAEEPMLYHYGTFEGTALKSVVIPDGVKYLPSKTFATVLWDIEEIHTGCALEEITLGKNFIGEINTGDGLYSEDSLYLYQHYYRLKSIKVAKGNPKYVVKNNILYSKDGETLYQAFLGEQEQNLTIDSKVKRIANGAFFRMQGIKEVTVKGDLDSIGYLAFAGSSLEKFTAEGGIQKIGAGAFVCSKLNEFDCKKGVDFVGTNAFGYAHYNKFGSPQLGNNVIWEQRNFVDFMVKLF